MNILIFSWRGPGHPLSGGAELATHEHAKAWIKAGHKVTLFTSHYNNSPEQEVIDNVEIIRKGKDVFGVQFKAFWWYCFSNHRKFDVVVDQFHGIPFFTPIFVRTKKIAYIHEVAKEVWQLNPWPKPLNLIPGIIGPIFEPLIFKLFYKNILFLTVSNSTKSDLINWGIPGKNIYVVLNGVRIINIQQKKEPRKILTYLGSLSKDKGIEDAIKVFASLDNQVYQYWIIGKGDTKYVEYLKSEIKKSGIEDKVKFWGYVSEMKKFSLLAKSYIIINPSIREGWGMVVTEAAAMGTPTVGYDVAGLRDSIINGKTGILSSRNYLALKQAVEKLLQDDKKYKVMVKNCIKWSKEFSWEKAGRKSLAILTKL